MHYKKILAGILCTGMIGVAALTGCSGNSTGGGENTVALTDSSFTGTIEEIDGETVSVSVEDRMGPKGMGGPGQLPSEAAGQQSDSGSSSDQKTDSKTPPEMPSESQGGSNGNGKTPPEMPSNDSSSDSDSSKSADTKDSSDSSKSDNSAKQFNVVRHSWANSSASSCCHVR